MFIGILKIEEDKQHFKKDKNVVQKKKICIVYGKVKLKIFVGYSVLFNDYHKVKIHVYSYTGIDFALSFTSGQGSHL